MFSPNKKKKKEEISNVFLLNVQSFKLHLILEHNPNQHLNDRV
jgi:hypothetical protein